MICTQGEIAAYLALPDDARKALIASGGPSFKLVERKVPNSRPARYEGIRSEPCHRVETVRVGGYLDNAQGYMRGRIVGAIPADTAVILALACRKSCAETVLTTDPDGQWHAGPDSDATWSATPRLAALRLLVAVWAQ